MEIVLKMEIVLNNYHKKIYHRRSQMFYTKIFFCVWGGRLGMLFM